METLTVGQVAAALKVSDSSIRNWTAEFADHLSDAATPPKGKPRRYSVADVEVLQTVATMSMQRQQSYDDIKEFLAAGNRVESFTPPQVDDAPGQAADPGPGSALVPMSLLETVEKSFLGVVHALEDERNYLRQQLDDERAARVEAERRAAEAEARAARRPWWRFWERE